MIAKSFFVVYTSSMQITKTHKIIISIIALAILLGIYVFFDRKSRSTEEVPVITNEATTTTPTKTTTTKTTTGVSNIEGTGNYTIEQVGGGNDFGPVPDLNRKVTVSTGVAVSPEATAMATDKITALQGQLKTNSSDFKAWINLGIYQKMAGDYQGAVLSWKYASRLAPADYISLSNLGNLYAYFIKDNGQAEVYYKQAINNGPTQVYLYVGLVEIYRDIFKDLDKARAIVDAGLSKIPNDPNLLQLKSSLSAPAN